MAKDKLNSALDALEQAREPVTIVRLANEALSLPREQNPMVWASLHGSIGSALVASAQGRFSAELAARVIDAYQASLTVYTPQETPDIWAQTMRNLGATHLGALQSGVGDPQQHLQAAIAAYEKALELPPERHFPDSWLRCQQELAAAWEIASIWHGPPALVRAARCCETAAAGVDRQQRPELWAELKLKSANCLNETGVEEYSEEAIRACSESLEVLTAEHSAQQWAQAQLILGTLYRTRQHGDRELNLESAVASLNQALTRFTEETTPREWYTAHYNRGPAYLFRLRGDRAENLEQALISLRIAVARTPREQAPDAWAALLVTLAQVCLERRNGDPGENTELAIEALESALEVLPADARSRQWTLARRYLGQAYLARHSGSRKENMERAIDALESVQGQFPQPDDPQAWCAAQANLAEAYRRRAQGDPQQNRQQAIRCLQAAVALSPQHWGDTPSWFMAQAHLALLLMDQEASTIGETESRPPESAETGVKAPIDRVADPFESKQQAGEITAALTAELRSGNAPRATDADWHVPFLLNEEVAKLQHHFKQFLGSGGVVLRSAEERSALEVGRWRFFRMVFEHLQEKYAAARRTQGLLNSVMQGQQGFVLFLRGFAYRSEYYRGGTVMRGSGANLGESLEKRKLVARLAPVPVVWISNPVESGPLELVMDGMTAAQQGYRIEAGATWESDVRTLISAASTIIVYNPVMTPGVVHEIGVVEELGRVNDTLFFVPESAQKLVKSGTAHRLDDAVLERIRSAPPHRMKQTTALPAPTCQWLQGKRRDGLTTEATVLGQWLEQLARNGNGLATDLALDGGAYLLASLMLLEDLDPLPLLLEQLARTLHEIDRGALREAADLSRGYAGIAARLSDALKNTPASLSGIERTARALEIVQAG